MTNPTLFDVDTDDATAWKRWNKAFRPLPAERPTEAAPGSKEKIRVITERIHAGQELFHPLDHDDGRNLS